MRKYGNILNTSEEEEDMAEDRFDAYEKHFNDLQHKTRVIASTWILAGFGAVAYFIKATAPVLVHFSSYTMINLISLMVVSGLFVLWILDQIVYQRLLNATFAAGFYREYKKKPQVPPIRALMIIGSEYRGMSRWYNLFYFIPMAVFTLFSTASWLLEMSTKPDYLETNYTSIVIGMGLILVTVFIWRFIFDKKRGTPYTNLLESFGDKEFEKAKDLEGCEALCHEIISDWEPS